MSPVKARTFPSIALSFGPGFFLKKKWSEMASFDGLFSNCCLFNQPKPQLWGHKRIRCFLYLFSVLIRTQSALQQSPNSQSLPQTHNKLPKEACNPHRASRLSKGSQDPHQPCICCIKSDTPTRYLPERAMHLASHLCSLQSSAPPAGSPVTDPAWHPLLPTPGLRLYQFL